MTDKIKPDSIVEQVRQELLDRSNTGIKKYGVTLDREDLTLDEWVQHAREEALDLALYLTKVKKVIQEYKKVKRNFGGINV